MIVGVETTNRPALAKEFTSSIGVTFPILLDDQGVTGKLFDVHATPTTLFIDRKGTVLFKHVGYSPGDEKHVAATIEHMLASRE